jgi:hypothetical protein
MPNAAVEIIRTADRAAAVLQPARLRLLQELMEPDSAAGLARKLGLPRQKINYHLRELEHERVVEFVEERRKGNCIERMVRATARSYMVSPEAFGAMQPDPHVIRDRFSLAYLVARTARAISDLMSLRTRADAAKKTLATLTLETEIRFASAEDRAAFTRELTAHIAHLTAKYHNEAAPNGRRFQFFLGGYPAITPKHDEHVADSVRLED